MGGQRPKAFLPLGGIPILARTLKKFEACPLVDEIVALVPGGEVALCAREIVQPFGLKKVSRIIVGGPERQDTVYYGLKAVEGKADFVIIHDGARPFVSPELIGRAISQTLLWKAVIAAIPAGDTIKEVSEEKEVQRTLDRSHLWIIQTPQSFEYGLIAKAQEKAREEGFGGTDEASLVERMGIPVKVIEGSRFNLKITTPEDLVLGEALLRHLGEI